jgi:hypothetical protein
VEPTSITPVHKSESSILAFGPSVTTDGVRGNPVLASVDGEYYLIRLTRPVDLDQILGKDRYLALGDVAIFRSDAREAEKVARFGWGLTKLQPLPHSPVSPTEYSPPAVAVVDSNILEMISVITPQSSHDLIAVLSAIPTRYSYAEGCRLAEQYVFDQFALLGLNSSFFPFQYGGTDMRNVIGEKLGVAYPESVIIVCGHLDCTSEMPDILAPGAEDNGSGSAVVLEAARAISPFPCSLTVRFVTFSGEEQGLIGSDYYAAYVDDRNESIVAVINADMVAYSGPYAQDIYVFSDRQSYSLGALGASIISEYTDLDTVTRYESLPRYGSDHYSFAIRGFPAIFFIDAWFDFDWYPYYHTAADTLGNLNMAQQAAIGQAIAALAATLAHPNFGPQFIAGDVNGSGDVNGIDVVYLVSYLKGGPPPPDPILRADANGSCTVNGIDVVYLVAYLKGYGQPPIYGDCRSVLKQN